MFLQSLPIKISMGLTKIHTARFYFVLFTLLMAAPCTWAEEALLPAKSQNSLALRGATTITSNQVTGSGFTSTQPDATMTTYGLSLKHKPIGSWIFLILDYNVTSGQQEVAPELTPTEISYNRTELKFSMLSDPFYENDRLKLQGSLVYKTVNYSIDETTPNVALTNLNTRGPTASLKLKKDFATPTDSLESDLELYFPHHIQEGSATTGFSPSALGFEAQIKFIHKFAPQWQAAIGAKYQYESIQYKGTGTRGTIDAKDVRTQFTFPLELEYLF